MDNDNHELEPSDDEENFAAMLEQSLSETGTRVEPGQKVDARVLQLGAEWIFLDVGQKGEGVLDVKELQDADGKLTVAVGDIVSAYFVSSAGGELRFTTRLGGGASGTEQLEQAWQNGIPVEGRIEKEIKGGYEIRLPGGVRAFCPFSQLGLRRQETPEAVLGQDLTFRISQFSEQGRNIVVSHRDIQEEERRQLRESLRETLKEGQVVKGTVTNIRDFGAFIDIGGLEGLLPISEVSHSRIEDLHEVLSVGQEVEVALKSCDWDNNRFSFSLRDTLADPWNKVGSVFAEGLTHTGTVSRLANFGAFVTLDDGLDGLLHISKLGGGRHIKHPKEELMVGQQLQVTIEQIDRDARRISLAPASSSAAEEQNSYVEQPSSGSMGTFADLLRASQEKKR
jgi:small subunit ribosomal protein S1